MSSSPETFTWRTHLSADGTTAHVQIGQGVGGAQSWDLRGLGVSVLDHKEVGTFGLYRKGTPWCDPRFDVWCGQFDTPRSLDEPTKRSLDGRPGSR